MIIRAREGRSDLRVHVPGGVAEPGGWRDEGQPEDTGVHDVAVGGVAYLLLEIMKDLFRDVVHDGAVAVSVVLVLVAGLVEVTDQKDSGPAGPVRRRRTGCGGTAPGHRPARCIRRGRDRRRPGRTS
jgi:hypothetical protein